MGCRCARTESPTLTLLELPSASGRKVSPAVGIRNTAMSCDGSLLMMLASTVRPCSRPIVIFAAPSTTCQSVRIVPSPSTSNPEPVAVARCPPSPLEYSDDDCGLFIPTSVYKHDSS